VSETLLDRYPLPTALTERIGSLSRKQERVLEFLVSNPMAGASVTIEQIAEQLDVSVSTVIRTAKELGYSGFGALKRDLRAAYLNTLEPLEQARVRITSRIDPDFVAAQLERDAQNLEDLLETVDVAQIVKLGRDIATARRSFLAHEVAALGRQDVVIVVGFWRDRASHLRVATHAKGKGTRLVAITDASGSHLARIADDTFLVPTESTAFYQSMVAATALAYAIVNAVWQFDSARGETVAEEAQALYTGMDMFLSRASRLDE
jgi:DNA-binding MurR/RpiR family transcriptional regulator